MICGRAGGSIEVEMFRVVQLAAIERSRFRRQLSILIQINLAGLPHDMNEL
jgi:hypothetical protein